ncbi:DUF3906 family protein [Paenibacillus cisolokensis]|jgi:hypothetical protein|uniref:DUF3906 family protein n=1 Tax=Paenibacillus TaxID=44249 RepID=UPI000721E756|nr:DUF3906 family protein [Paenibacillus sp. 32O-W]ALS28975.1 hypothetical protein IJ21_35870 [Paenibacillus sp. 32O-W]
MMLYKIEIQFPEQKAYLVLLAENDQKAFAALEAHIDRHYLKAPGPYEAAIVEKKRPEPGSGYLIEG